MESLKFYSGSFVEVDDLVFRSRLIEFEFIGNEVNGITIDIYCGMAKQLRSLVMIIPYGDIWGLHHCSNLTHLQIDPTLLVH